MGAKSLTERRRVRYDPCTQSSASQSEGMSAQEWLSSSAKQQSGSIRENSRRLSPNRFLRRRKGCQHATQFQEEPVGSRTMTAERLKIVRSNIPREGQGNAPFILGQTQRFTLKNQRNI